MILQCPDCGRGHGFVVPGAHYTCRCGTVLLYTSPDDDARLLPWIDATGPLLDGGIVDTSSCFDDAARRACASQAPAADERAELFASTLLAMVASLSESEYRALLDDVKQMQGYNRLNACLMHSDDVKCECCQDDPI